VLACALDVIAGSIGSQCQIYWVLPVQVTTYRETLLDRADWQCLAHKYTEEFRLGKKARNSHAAHMLSVLESHIELASQQESVQVIPNLQEWVIEGGHLICHACGVGVMVLIQIWMLRSVLLFHLIDLYTSAWAALKHLDVRQVNCKTGEHRALKISIWRRVADEVFELYKDIDLVCDEEHKPEVISLNTDSSKLAALRRKLKASSSSKEGHLKSAFLNLHRENKELSYWRLIQR
jgi:hypothetical protein